MEQNHDHSANGHSAKPLDGQPCRGGETIFIVEDVSELRELVREILESYGYNTVEAADGVKAMSVWNEHKGKIDLLLTDVMMPGGVSGRELAARLRGDQPGLKVIYTSGHSIDSIGEGNLREGLNFLQKPYRPLTLAQTIRACLDSHAAN